MCSVACALRALPQKLFPQTLQPEALRPQQQSLHIQDQQGRTTVTMAQRNGIQRLAKAGSQGGCPTEPHELGIGKRWVPKRAKVQSTGTRQPRMNKTNAVHCGHLVLFRLLTCHWLGSGHDCVSSLLLRVLCTQLSPVFLLVCPPSVIPVACCLI